MGGIVWIASPSSVTAEGVHGGTGGEAVNRNAVRDAGSDAANRRRRSGCHRATSPLTRCRNASESSSRRSSGSTSGRASSAQRTYGSPAAVASSLPVASRSAPAAPTGGSNTEVNSVTGPSTTIAFIPRCSRGGTHARVSGSR